MMKTTTGHTNECGQHDGHTGIPKKTKFPETEFRIVVEKEELWV